MNRIIAALCLVHALSAFPAFAYKELVHRRITRSAFQQLQLDFRAKLGVPRNHQVINKELVSWMQDGSYMEDSRRRPLNHFLDPVHSPVGRRAALPGPRRARRHLGRNERR